MIYAQRFQSNVATITEGESAMNPFRSVLDRVVTSRPLNRATLFLLDEGFKRFGHMLPRDALEGIDSIFFRDAIGNIDLDGDGVADSFRLAFTNPWYDQRITGIELYIDGRKVPPERILFRSPAGDTRASDVVALEFAPGPAMEVVAEGRALSDGYHVLDLTLEMELADQIIPLLPLVVRDGVGDVAILPDRFDLPGWPPSGLAPGTAHVVPHIHYDVEWLQTRAVFERVGAGNLKEMLRLLDADPEMTFVVDQVPQLEPFRREHPGDFERIVRLVGEGRIEPVNGMYSEPDVNLLSGESLVRQSVAWQRYALEHFGALSRCGWLIDSFGMSPQLPQIFTRSGSGFFAYSRARPPEGTPSEFLWEGLDGTRIPTTAMPLKYNVGHPVPSDRERALKRMLKNYRLLRSRSASEQVFYPGGVDHGRPQKEYGEMARAWNSEVSDVKFHFSLPSRFFEALPREKLPVVRGDLQRELWGTYSSRIEIKQRNRECEFALLDAGKLATVASLFGAPYPAAELDAAWRTLMDNHFHDQVCGCCVDEVAAGMMRRFDDVQAAADEVMAGSASFLCGGAGGPGGAAAPAGLNQTGFTLLVFNPLAQPETSWVEFEALLPPGWRGLSVSRGGGRLPVQVVDATLYGDGSLKRVRAGFLPELPALGYSVFELEPGEEDGPGVARPVTASGMTVSNGLISVELDGSTGLLKEASLADGARFDLAGGNRLTLERDFGNLYESLAFGTTFMRRRRADSIRVVESGPLRGTIEVKGTVGRSPFVQRVSLKAGSPRIDLESRVDLRDTGCRLRCRFPTGMAGGTWTHEVPYGCIERPGHELAALNFVDLSRPGEGISLINHGIPGNECDRRGTINLTLLRSVEGIWFWKAGPGALEQKEHTFRYALYPHRGGWREAGSVAEARRHNNPPRVLVLPGKGFGNAAPDRYGALECMNPDVLVSVLERARGGGVMIRCWETAGRRAEAEFALGWDAGSASRADLLEREQEALEVEGGRLELELGPFEIATVVLAWSAAGQNRRASSI